MPKPLYITTEGILARKSNTLYFINKDMKKPIPIHALTDIYAHAKVSLRSGAIFLLIRNNIPVHFYNKFGYYEGSLLPRKKRVSGNVLIKQAEHYLDPNKRLYIAREILEGMRFNMIRILKYYKAKGKEVDEEMNARTIS